MEQLRAGVQYGDVEGTVEVDYSFGQDLSDFAKKHGIDTDRYTPVAVTAFGSEHGYFHVSILALDNQIAGHTFEDQTRYLDSCGNRPKLKKLDIEATPAEFLDAFHRISIVIPAMGVGNRIREYDRI